MPVALRPGHSYPFTLLYGNSVAAGAVHRVSPWYTFKYISSWGVSSAYVGADRANDWRCDDTFGNRNAGCVFPDYTPTMHSMTQLPFIAQNIRNIQQGGFVAGFYGQYRVLGQDAFWVAV